MKKIAAFFATCFNKKQSIPEKTTQEVLVNSFSQHHVLQHRMKEEKLTHGETVKADLSPVRLEYHEAADKMHMYFCPLQAIGVIEKVSPGDGGSLPAEAILKDIKIDKNLKPGLYNLKNVTLFSNGTLQVIANEDTKFEPFEQSQSFPDAPSFMSLADLERTAQLRFHTRRYVQNEVSRQEYEALSHPIITTQKLIWGYKQ
jgi:hypothetical protein